MPPVKHAAETISPPGSAARSGGGVRSGTRGGVSERQQHDDVVAVVAGRHADRPGDAADLLVSAAAVEGVDAGAAAAGQPDRLDAVEAAGGRLDGGHQAAAVPLAL